MIAKPLDGKVNVTTRTTAAACIEHNQVRHVVEAESIWLMLEFRQGCPKWKSAEEGRDA